MFIYFFKQKIRKYCYFRSILLHICGEKMKKMKKMKKIIAKAYAETHTFGIDQSIVPNTYISNVSNKLLRAAEMFNYPNNNNNNKNDLQHTLERELIGVL